MAQRTALRFVAGSVTSAAEQQYGGGPQEAVHGKQAKPKNLVIVGTGWAGYSLFRSIDKSKFNVTVVSSRNHFLFNPLLASTAVGTLEFRSIIQPMREAGFRDETHFVLAETIDVDSDAKTIRCRSTVDPAVEYTIGYDALCLAHGAAPSTFGIPGVLEHAHFLKELHHAREIRRKLLGNLELACQKSNTTLSPARRNALLNVVIVGGGPTGVEFGAELTDFVADIGRRLYKEEAKEIRVTLIEGNGILTMFAASLREYATKKIEARPNMQLLKGRVVRVNADSVDLADGTVVPAGLIVWTAGIGPQPLTLALQAKGWAMVKNRLAINGMTQVEGRDGVYAIGDCASTPVPLPQTAQAAEQSGVWLAKHLGGQPVKPFEFASEGLLAYIGGFQALAELGLPMTDHKRDLHDRAAKLRGFTALLVWRGAYFTKLGSWRLRLQVPLDWIKTFLFGRDISRF